jgi:DNA-binding CsgD family transcriptional regulator/sugar-specific transcriptional regulator TrmB
MFEALGLDHVTESVYLAMLDSPDDDLAAIAAGLGLTEAGMRDALDNLAQMSLLRRSGPGSVDVEPVDPEAGLTALVSRRQQEIEESKASFAAVLARHSRARAKAEPGVERLVGIDEIRHRLAELARTCEWEACSFMPGGAQSAESLAASRGPDAEAIERGVRLRTVYLDSVRNDQPTLDYAEWLAAFGSEVRTTASLPLRLLIVDRKLAIVPVNTEDTQDAAIVVSSDGMLAALVALFHSVWKAATPLAANRRRDEEGLSPQDRQVLLFLAEGCTDETIARRLGVSVRTARRVASDLLARLGARSRFQAGARAVARDWIAVDDLD